jgi:ABC-2 type transport system permease protein
MGLTWVTLGGVVQCVFNEGPTGTLAITLGSPIDRRLLLLTRTAFHVPTGIVSVFVAVLVAAPVFGLDLTAVDWAAFLLATALTTLSIAAVALSLCTVSLAVRDMWSIVAFAGGLIAAFSGGFVPSSMLPSPLDQASRVIPMHWGVEAMRSAFRGETGSLFGTALLYEGFNGLLWLLLAMSVFQFFESSLKKRGAWDAV